jgi:phage virion morphogenesis protein
MAGIRYSFELKDQDLQELFKRLELVGRSRQAMRDAANLVRHQAMLAFEEEESPGGEKWEPSQRAESEGGQTLSDTGMLKGSIDTQVFPDHAVVGSNLVYAAIHQLGGAAGRGHSVNLPARPFLPDEESIDRDKIVDIFISNIQRVLE